MFKTTTIHKDVMLSAGDFPIIPLKKAKKVTRLAIECLNEFFETHPEAMLPGAYRVEMYWTLPSMTLFYDVYRFETK